MTQPIWAFQSRSNDPGPPSDEHLIIFTPTLKKQKQKSSRTPTPTTARPHGSIPKLPLPLHSPRRRRCSRRHTAREEDDVDDADADDRTVGTPRCPGQDTAAAVALHAGGRRRRRPWSLRCRSRGRGLCRPWSLCCGPRLRRPWSLRRGPRLRRFVHSAAGDASPRLHLLWPLAVA